MPPENPSHVALSYKRLLGKRLFGGVMNRRPPALRDALLDGEPGVESGLPSRNPYARAPANCCSWRRTCSS